MNLLERIFKRRKTLQKAQRKLADSQSAIYRAVALINKPCTGRQVAKFLAMDSASVTPRLAELVKKDRLQIAYKKRGLDRKWRNYYVTKHS